MVVYYGITVEAQVKSLKSPTISRSQQYISSTSRLYYVPRNRFHI